MRTRRGSLLNGTTFGDAILMYKPGDVVKSVLVTDQFFTGVVRDINTKTNKITVAWGGGPESQHDVDEIMPMPFFGSAQKDGAKVASCRRMKAEDVGDLLDAPEIGEEIADSESESTDQTDFLDDDMESLLNRQVGAEFYSAYLYYMVAAIFQSKGLVGFQAWMERQGDGEIEHAMKVYKYLMDTGSNVELPEIPGPALSGDMEVAELTRAVLDHEMGVTGDWKRIGALSKEQDNPATCQLVQWFMTEQVEEEDAALTLHQRVQLADSGSGILLIDNDLKDRSPIAVTATNPPMDQYCGEPGTHGLDKPVGGGFSVMNDLAYELHDEANQFADVNPRIASIKAGLKEIVSDANTMTCAECDATQFLRKATQFLRKATINYCPRCREMLDEDDSEWLGEDGAGIGWNLCYESCPKCGFEKTYKMSERGQMKDVRIKNPGRPVAATSGDEPPAQRTIWEETAKKSSVSRKAFGNIVGKIMAYENGEMDEDQTVEFFQELIDTGYIHHLQGSYGRMAQHLIDQGLCHRRGQAASSKTATDWNLGEKKFDVQTNIGKAKYVVNFHNGVKTHNDGSAFFDIHICHNKPDLEKFTKELRQKGYKEASSKGLAGEDRMVGSIIKRMMASGFYGKTVVLNRPAVNVECWNFTDRSKHTIPAGSRIRLESENDATSTICMLVDEKGNSHGIDLTYADGKTTQKGYRFIIDNAVLNDIAGLHIPTHTSDVVVQIMDYEGGNMSKDEIVEFFQELIDSGMVSQLQGSYGRMAENLIQRGLCHRKGQKASSKTADWLSGLPVECDFCHKTITNGWFVDGATDEGPWGNMCQRCFQMHGRGLGTGKGQKYDAVTGRKLQGSEKTATGEMGMHDIQPGGDHYEWAQVIEKAAKEIQRYTRNLVRFQEVRPFDVYKGPYARMNRGKLWSADEEGQFYYETGVGFHDFITGTPDDIADEILARSGKTASDKFAGLKSRRAMYWCAPDRTFRLTQQEQQSGAATCPKCRSEMQVEPYTRSDKLMICPECRFKVPTSKAVTKVEVKVPAGIEVDVTTQGENGEEVTGEAIMANTRRGRFMASGQKYKGYTIEKSGDNFYVKDPSGHRVFGEVPATVEVAKRWIDQEISEKGSKTGSDCRRGRLAYADPTNLADLSRMSLSQIASLIYKDWKNVNFAAKPYLQAMSTMQNVSDMCGMDSGTSIVAYMLSNSSSWRGDVAKAIKKELQRRIR